MLRFDGVAGSPPILAFLSSLIQTKQRKYPEECDQAWLELSSNTLHMLVDGSIHQFCPDLAEQKWNWTEWIFPFSATASIFIEYSIHAGYLNTQSRQNCIFDLVPFNLNPQIQMNEHIHQSSVEKSDVCTNLRTTRSPKHNKHLCTKQPRIATNTLHLAAPTQCQVGVDEVRLVVDFKGYLKWIVLDYFYLYWTRFTHWNLFHPMIALGWKVV